MVNLFTFAVSKDQLQKPTSQVPSMITHNDYRKKLDADEPATSIFDSPAVCKALSMRSSCNYPGSIIDQVKSSQGKKPFGTSQTSARAGAGRRIVGTVSDTVVPSGDQCQSDSSSSSSIGTDYSNDDRVPGIGRRSEEHEGAAGATRGGENSNSVAFEAQSGGALVEKTIVRRRNKKEDLTSSTDTESDEEVSTSEYASKSKNVHSKSRKRKKKLTANLAGTRYDVGKNRCRSVFLYK